jgi:DNA-binding transcriptional MerR regulator
MLDKTNIYLIKDLARLSGYSIYTIKYYLKLGLIRESGRSPETQFRYFDDSTRQQLARIRDWRKQGRGLAEIAKKLGVS